MLQSCLCSNCVGSSIVQEICILTYGTNLIRQCIYTTGERQMQLQASHVVFCAHSHSTHTIAKYGVGREYSREHVCNDYDDMHVRVPPVFLSN